MKVSRIRFWWCSACNGVYRKDGLEMRIQMFEGPCDAIVSGTVECCRCHAVYQASDVWAGTHDLPWEHWREFQNATGERMEL